MINLKMKNPLKGKKLVQLVILIGTIAIFSTCEKDADDFGSDVVAGRDSITVLKDTIYDLSTYLKRETAFKTQGAGILYLGNLSDEYFGQTLAHSIGQYVPVSTRDSLTEAAYDSVRAEVVIYYDNIFGDTTEPLNINLYKINKALNVDTNYYSNEDPEEFYSSADLISESTELGSDSIYRIKLTDAFTQKLKEATFDTTSFTDFMSGILFTTGDNTGKGSIISAPVSEYELYLYDTNPSDTVPVDDTLDFSINQIRFNMFEHDYSKATQTPNAYTALNSEEEDSLLFVQNLQGTRTKVTFSNLEQIKEKYEGKLIANASLIFNVKEQFNPSDSTESNMRAFIYKSDSTYTRLNSYVESVVNIRQQDYEAIYDKENNEMVFNLSAYYQSLLNGRIKNNTIYLHTKRRNTGLNHTVLSGSNSSTPARLEIEYYNTSK
jgi:hypothetical protein